MKIKDILTGLLSGEDFSDHSTGKEDGSAPFHDVPGHCVFCDAWRAALAFVNGYAPLQEMFDAGEKVFLPGGIPGRVMSTDVTVRVEVQRGEHGPWAVGSFSPLALIARNDVPEFTWWRDQGGAIWQRHEPSQRVVLVRDEDDIAPNGLSNVLGRPGGEFPFVFDAAEKRWGPFTQVDKP